MTSSDYVIATARERLEAWANHLNKSITHINGDYVLSLQQDETLTNSGDNSIFIIVISSVIGLSFGIGFLLAKKKKYR